jgi:hypothetical protein
MPGYRSTVGGDMGAFRILGLLMAGIVATGCGAGTGPTAAQSAGPTSAPTTAVASEPVSTGPAVLAEVYFESSIDVAAGDYVTAGGGFHPGMTLTIPDGWVLGQNSQSELKLTPADRPDHLLEMWQAVAAVVPDNQHGTVGQILPDVGPTSA